MKWPLDGVKVVDLTQNVAGPFASSILADLGADVIKIEPPQGDATRTWGPPFWSGESPAFLALNRNKRGVRLDLKQSADKTRLASLLSDTDVLLVSGRPGAMQRLGLGFDTLHTHYPRLIYGEVTPFGQSGPLKDRPGYDPLMQAMVGIMSVNTVPGEEPSRVGVSIIDMGCAQWLAIGVLSALRARDLSGEGMRVTASLFDTAVGWMTYHLASYWASGISPRGWGSGTAMIVPYQAFPVSDGWLVIAAGNDRLFRELARVLDRPEWITDERYSTNAARVRNREPLIQSIAERTRTRTHWEWQVVLDAVGIPSAPVQTVEDVARSEQLKTSGIIQQLTHNRISDFRAVGLPLTMNGIRPAIRKPPPE